MTLSKLCENFPHRRRGMPRAFTAEDFEVGARALVDRWSTDPAAMHESMTVRWVEETDPLRRNAAAGGYVAAEGHLVVDEGVATEEYEDGIDNIDSGLRVTDEYEDEDDDAVAARTAPPRRVHRRSYHLVYSRSYGCPVLLIRGVKCDGARVMNHAEMEASLVSASTRGAEDGDDVDRRRDALVLGESGLSVFAPWEHPHLGQGGGWLGVHPCETRDAMALLLGGDKEGWDAGRYMSAWISFVAAAVADLPVPAHRCTN